MVKVITVGNGAVGKTSLIRRFCEGVFTGVYQKTLAVDFVEKQDFVVPGVEEPGSKQNTHSVLSRTIMCSSLEPHSIISLSHSALHFHSVHRVCAELVSNFFGVGG